MSTRIQVIDLICIYCYYSIVDFVTRTFCYFLKSIPWALVKKLQNTKRCYRTCSDDVERIYFNIHSFDFHVFTNVTSILKCAINTILCGQQVKSIFKKFVPLFAFYNCNCIISAACTS